MMPGSVLSRFRVHLPAHRGAHADVVRWLAAAHARAEQTSRRDDPTFDPAAFHRQMERHLRRFAPSPETVGYRYSDINEFLDENFSDKDLFPVDRLPQGVSTATRMDAFADMAERALRALYDEGDTAPEELVHVTCTGYAAPSAPQVLIEELRMAGAHARDARLSHGMLCRFARRAHCGGIPGLQCGRGYGRTL